MLLKINVERKWRSMENLKMYYLLLLAMFISSYGLYAQINSDRETVAKVYDLLQDVGAGPAHVRLLTKTLDWGKIRSTANLDERHNISFPAIMQNHWRSLEFHNLKFIENRNNKILVTGRVIGRQPTDCGIISTNFTHTWEFHNGEIIGFSE